MNMASSSKLEDLNVTQDEIKRISDALKDENFRKLFVEYAEEISNPENRRLYEEEITQMENERGMDIQFVNPKGGHVLETSVDGDTRAFINICHNEHIEKPKSVRQRDANGKPGMMWQIPHSFAQPRDEVDGGKKCLVFDVVFNPDTYRMSETNERFLKLVHDTAFDGIEKQFDKKIDRKNVKRLDLNFKGTPQATVIRKKKGEDKTKDANSEMSDLLNKMPYPYDKKSTEEKMKEREAEIKKREDAKAKKNAKTKKGKNNKESKATVPEFTIVHRSDLDLQEYRNSPDSRTSTRPKDLIVKIFLPLLPGASCASLDIFEQRLKLVSKEPASYELDIKLPYPVLEDEGSAKFDKGKRCLIVTLPVLPAETPKLPSFIEDEKRINGDTPDCAQSYENDQYDIVEKPKIEVLTSLENDAQISQNMSSNTFVNIKETVPPPVSTISYSLPKYTYNQDIDTLSFVISVKNISAESISKSFPSSNSMRVSFVSLGSGGFPMYYCLYMKFDETCKIASEHCNTDLTEENLVLVLLKDKSCRVLWDRFHAGLDADHLEEKLLLTDESLQKQLYQLDIEAETVEQTENRTSYRSPTLEVTEMKDKKLTINIKSATLNEDEDDDYDPPSSADIEVIHKKAPPKLHSILKQRTLSESSDDPGCSGGESPRSAQEECTSPDSARKSVSFNSHIDSATFKKNTAPTSMKTALKSKRRRARKKEEKKAANTRRRRNSGSETSSGEELSNTDSYSPSSDKEEDEHFEKIAEDEEGETEEGKKGGVAGSGAGEGSVKAEKDNQDFRTSVKSGSVVSKKKAALVEAIKSKVAAEDIPQADSDDGDEDEDDDDNGRTCSKSARILSESKMCDEVKGMSVRDDGKPPEGDTIPASSISKPGNLQQVIESQDSSVIKVRAENKASTSNNMEETDSQAKESGDGEPAKTMLSWKEQGDGQEDLSSLDHRTQCAFSFTNSVIYDLDVD